MITCGLEIAGSRLAQARVRGAGLRERSGRVQCGAEILSRSVAVSSICRVGSGFHSRKRDSRNRRSHASTLMPRVLILTAGYGEGHNAAARGLLAAAAHLGVDAEIADPFTAMGPAYDRSRRDYLAVINRAPRIWAAVFQLIDRLPLVEFTLPLLSAVGEELARLL